MRYDESYGVIHEIILRKFRALMEPFCESKFSKYVVEYLAHVSSEYLISSVLPSLTSSDAQTSHVLLADVILCI